VYRIIIIFKG